MYLQIHSIWKCTQTMIADFEGKEWPSFITCFCNPIFASIGKGKYPNINTEQTVTLVLEKN